MSSSSDTGFRFKRPKLSCAIHCSDDRGSLVAPVSIESWRTILRAAEIRTYTPILELASECPDDSFPPILYHRKCRSLFTMKKTLDGILAKGESESIEVQTDDSENIASLPSTSLSETIRRSCRGDPQSVRTYDDICIFCEKLDKYAKGSKSREGLTKCRELRADDSVRRAATVREDSRVLAIVSRELVAAEAHYHRSCYRILLPCKQGIVKMMQRWQK